MRRLQQATPRSRLAYLLLCLHLCGCAATGPWKLDSIAASDPSFDSARLAFQDLGQRSQLRLEFLRLGTAIDFYVSAVHYPFNTSKQDPSSLLVQFILEGDPPFEQAIPLLEGRMRLHIPHETTERIAEALQKGKNVRILVDGYEETLSAENFPQIYEKFSEGSGFLNKIFRGPIE